MYTASLLPISVHTCTCKYIIALASAGSAGLCRITCWLASQVDTLLHASYGVCIGCGDDSSCQSAHSSSTHQWRHPQGERGARAVHRDTVSFLSSSLLCVGWNGAALCLLLSYLLSSLPRGLLHYGLFPIDTRLPNTSYQPRTPLLGKL